MKKTLKELEADIDFLVDKLNVSKPISEMNVTELIEYFSTRAKLDAIDFEYALLCIELEEARAKIKAITGK